MAKKYATKDPEVLLRYNALDTIATARVYAAHVNESEWREPRTKQLYEVHEQLAIIAAEMHSTGILVDEERRLFMSFCLQQEYEEKAARFADVAGVAELKPTPQNMRSLLFKRYEKEHVKLFGMDDPDNPKMYSDDGDIKVDKDALIQLVIDPHAPEKLKKLIKAFWDAEKPRKARSTYIDSDSVLHAIGHDGRLRPGWNTCGTDTMRWSCSEPNVMNLKQDMRAMYRASKGCQLVHADKSQLELRVMAARAPDAELQRRLESGDVYTADAIDWFKLPPTTTKKNLKPEARKASKIIHLASQYAASLRAVYQQCLRQDPTIKFQAASLLHQGFFTTYKDTVDYWKREHDEVLKKGYSEGAILGGRRYYPRPPPITETANYPIQRTAAEMMNIETVKLWKLLKKHVPAAKLVFQLHDAVDIDTPSRKVGVVTRMLEDVMGAAAYCINGRQYTFPIEIKVGTHWDEV